MKKIENVKVVGVMYANNDGKNRQDILKEIYADRGDTVILEARNIPRRNGEGEAVCLCDKKTNQMIGWMDSDETRELSKRNHPKFYLGHIAYHGCYHVTIESISEKRMLEIEAELSKATA